MCQQGGCELHLAEKSWFALGFGASSSQNGLVTRRLLPGCRSVVYFIMNIKNYGGSKNAFTTCSPSDGCRSDALRRVVNIFPCTTRPRMRQKIGANVNSKEIELTCDVYQWRWYVWLREEAILKLDAKSGTVSKCKTRRCKKESAARSKEVANG